MLLLTALISILLIPDYQADYGAPIAGSGRPDMPGFEVAIVPPEGMLIRSIGFSMQAI
jgi:hypothetical protein